jgi:molecular chaperone GrpE
MRDESRMDMDRDAPLAEEPTMAASELSAEAAEEAAAEAEIAGDETAATLAELREEMESLTDRHLRLAAEFDNYRRRVERERAEYRVRAQADLVLPLLDLLDDLQRVSGLEVSGTTVESLLEGVGLIEKKFRRALEAEGLEPIDAAGEFFNPSTMEALMTVAAETPEEDDMVADIFQQGYRFKDLLIRPARVRVKKYES